MLHSTFILHDFSNFYRFCTVLLRSCFPFLAVSSALLVVKPFFSERIAGGKYLGRMFRLGREYQISDPQAAPFKYCGEPRHCRWNRCWTQDSRKKLLEESRKF